MFTMIDMLTCVHVVCVCVCIYRQDKVYYGGDRKAFEVSKFKAVNTTLKVVIVVVVIV